MSVPSGVTLGPLLQSVFRSASWEGQDDFPSNQIWADEIEKILTHLKAHNQLERYLPNLRGKLTQRNGALAEGRVSFFLNGIGYTIISWEPHGNANSLGEFEIQWKSSPPIFVEVKGPTWEGELGKNERNNGRKKAGKYIHAETRSLDTIGKVIEAINKTKKQKKFIPGRPNLLVINSSNMFVSPLELNPQIVVPKVKSALYELLCLGGVLIFNVTCRNLTIDYENLFIESEAEHCSGRLPDAVIDNLRHPAGFTKHRTTPFTQLAG